MSTTEHRLAANRINALQSTGPATAEGKMVASRNATRHGLLSAKLFLDDEDPDEFQSLLGELCRSLNPVGALEGTLVERIAVTLWRQRRLVQSETASLSLARQPRKIASGVASELGRGYGSETKPEELAPFDAEREQWCRQVLAEIEAVDEIDLASLETKAPLVHGQLMTEADEDHDEPAGFLTAYKDGLTGFVIELQAWCQKQLQEAEARPHLLALAKQVRAKRLVLPVDTLELLARYQTTLDNQLFKLLRALRDAQEWRLKTLEVGRERDTADAQDVSEAA